MPGNAYMLVCLCMQKPGMHRQGSLSSFMAPCLISLRQGLSVNLQLIIFLFFFFSLWLGWLDSKPQQAFSDTPLPHQSWDQSLYSCTHTATLDLVLFCLLVCLLWFWGSRLSCTASTHWDIFLCTFPYSRVQGYLPSHLLAMSIQMPSHVFTSTSSYWTLFIKMKSISQWLKIDYLGTQEWWVLKFTSVGCGHKDSAVELGAVSK